MRLNSKALVSGIITGILIMCGCAVYAAGGLRYAVYNGSKVIYNSRLLNLNGKRLVSAAKDKERYASNYMPARAVFEAMGYEVGWNPETNTVTVTGEPGDTDYARLYWTQQPMEETDDSVMITEGAAAEQRPSRRLAITEPSGMSERERVCFGLISEIITAEMDADSGISSIVYIAKNVSDESEQAKKQLAAALYEAVNAGVSEGSKKVLGMIDAPGANSSSAYTTAYNRFKSYCGELDKMQESLKNGNLNQAFTYFDNAVDIYMNF